MKHLLLFGVLFFSGFSSQAQSLVRHTDTWRYRKGTGAPQNGWITAPDPALDATWLTGAGGFGYADNAAEVSLCATILDDMRGNYSTVAIRRAFEVTTPLDPALHLVLTVDWDDGFIAWLDGKYVASSDAPGAPSEPTFSSTASASHESSRGDNSAQPANAYDLGPIGSRLAPGPHVLAIMGLNNSKSGSSDFVLVSDLEAMAALTNCLSGAISNDLSLSGTNAVCASITVEPGATLTLTPGTHLEFAQNASLTVANGGRLIAEGSETNRIIFTKTETASAWGGIVVEGANGSPETRIAYADIEHNGTTAIHSSGGTVLLDHLTFLTTGHQYVSFDNSSFVVSNCYFPRGTAGFEAAHGTGGIKPGGHGIFVRNFFGGVRGYSDIADFTGGNRPGPIVHFIDNVLMDGDDDGLDLDGTDAWVEGNIFLHFHRNGGTPDSSAAVSGGDNGPSVSDVTIIGNLFFDCDNAATAKQGNFFTLLNNTIVHITRSGGIDPAAGAVNVRDTTPSPTTFARGLYLENNVISDIEELVRNYDAAQTTVTLNDNVIPVPWTGPGSGNIVTNALFVQTPSIPETQFTNWLDAQRLWGWLKLQPGSPGTRLGWGGTDEGAYSPAGVRLSSIRVFSNEVLRIDVGYHRTGNGIPASGWPDGAGYTDYKWRLDNGAWSSSVPIESPILLTNVVSGAHSVEVSGERDSSLFQDDPLFGPEASVSRLDFTAGAVTSVPLEISRKDGQVTLRFTAPSNGTYSFEYKDSLEDPAWTSLGNQNATANQTLEFTESPSRDHRFYRVAGR